MRAVLFALVPGIAWSQAQPPLLPVGDPLLRVRHLPGLTDLPVYTAVQDAEGRVWIGSWEGLLVTNGVDVVHYRHDPLDSTTIAGRAILNIATGGDTLLWLSTENGPCVFDLRTRTARRLKPPSEEGWPRCLHTLPGYGGRHWFATTKGLFSIGDLNERPRSHGPSDAIACHAVHGDPMNKGRLLVVASDAVHRFDPATGAWNALVSPLKEVPYYAGHSIVQDGSLWLCHWSLGVVRYDLRGGGGGLITYRRPDGSPTSFVAHFCVRDAHSLWVSTLDVGMVVLDTRTKLFTVRHPLEGTPRELMGIAVRIPLGLRDGTLLLCTDLGPFQLSRPRHRSTYLTYPDDGVVEGSPVWVSALAEDPSDGSLLVGTYDGPGLLRLQGDGRWEVIAVPPDGGLRSARIDRLLVARDGTLWVATRRGVFRMPRGAATIAPVDGMNGVRCRSLFEDREGNLWAGSANAGLFRIDARGGVSDNHRHRPGDPRSLVSDAEIRALAQDTLGRIWVGTRAGLSVMDPRSGACFNFGHDPTERGGFSEPHIRSIVRDGGGTMWVSCAQAGLRKVEVGADGAFSQQAMPGLEATHDLVIDRHDRIWAVDFGIGMLDTRSGIRRRFTLHDGIATLQTLDAALLVTHDGRLVLGVEGEPLLQVFDTRELLAPGAPASIEWTSATGATGPLPLGAPFTSDQRIQLRWSDQPLRIAFAAIDMSFPLDHQYHYRVLEQDSAWRDLGAERSLLFAALAPGVHTLQVRTSLNGRYMDNVRTLRIGVAAPWYRTIAFIIGASLGVLALAALLIRARIGAIRRKADFKRRLAEVEMQALRAQMNPHFLFNSLNSIKYYALTKDPRSTAAFLGTFAQLIRGVLRNSRASLVPLRDELEALRLYVEIEALRLEDKFAWHFDVDPSLDLDALLVPPMLLQPYVENAIWHGLMNKDGHGELRVRVAPEDAGVHCTIEDDGIGRARAEELKRGQGPRDRSYGMRITAERMELAAKAMGLGVTARVEDLHHADGVAAGTRVIVHIPLVREAATP